MNFYIIRYQCCVMKSYFKFSDKFTLRIILFPFDIKWYNSYKKSQCREPIGYLKKKYFVFKCLEKPLVPIGVGPVSFQGKIKITLPGREYFINRNENMFIFIRHVQYNLKWLMVTIHTCYICALCFTFIDQQRTTNRCGKTDWRDDWKVNWRSDIYQNGIL